MRADREQDDCTWENIKFRDITVDESIGGGGVAVVHRGMLKQRPVALKTLFDPRIDQLLKDEFLDELLVMSKLHHPNIVALIGACMEPPNLCIVMELCDCSLYHLLHETTTPLDSRSRTFMAKDVASAMQYLHGFSPAVIHRDLKSQNVLINPKGCLKLCDFGLVRTKVKSAGTPSYMPPELLSGGAFSKAVDVYMFGVLLWEIPFRGYDISDIRDRVLSGERMRIPTHDCPPLCQTLIARCWDGDPSKRPGFDEVVHILQETLSKGVAERVMKCDAMEDSLDSLLRHK